MPFRWRETVRSGNSTATVKNYETDTGVLVLMNIKGHFEPGMTIVGDVSGDTLTLTRFIINDDYDLNHDYDGWTDLLEIQVVCDDGAFVTTDMQLADQDLNIEYSVTV